LNRQWKELVDGLVLTIAKPGILTCFVNLAAGEVFMGHHILRVIFILVTSAESVILLSKTCMQHGGTFFSMSDHLVVFR